MPRNTRTTYGDAWQDHADFNEQIYLALRQSPWWMISIAVHVILFVITGLLYQESAAREQGPELAIEQTQRLDDEEEPPEPPMDPIVDETQPPKEPDTREVERADHDETDDNLDYDETLGEDLLDDASFQAKCNNSIIGLAGGAGGRWGHGRGGNEDLRRGGGRPHEKELEDALKWLKAHQSPNGGWEAQGFGRWCDGKPAAHGPDGAGHASNDAGVTGLALCAFLGAGYTNRGRHPFAKTVSKGLRYLKSIQDPEGCFGPRASTHYIYNHACAALAMVEAYGMTESTILRAPAQKALDFIALARNPYFVWRYGVKPGDNDTSVTGWMMMAMKSAYLINETAIEAGRAPLLRVDEEAFDGVRMWVDKMTDPDTGRVGYVQRGQGAARPRELIDKFPGDKTESMTAVGVLARIFTGEDPRGSAIIRKGADLCLKLPPTWNETDGSIDMYYWYYATLAMFQVGGPRWRTWNDHLKTGIVDHQRQDTDFCMYKGSWDPIGPWGPQAGRVYSTALMAMCLEIYYRYDNVFGT